MPNATISINPKDGVFNMKNFFLYIKIDDGLDQNYNLDDIFCFDGCKVIAIDISKYNKSYRYKLQQELNIRPYYITQSIFMEFLYFVINHFDHLLLRSITFKNKETETSEELSQLYNDIQSRNFNTVYEQVQKIMDIYDTDVEKIVIRFKGYDFTITSEGVLDTDAPDTVFIDFLKDKVINRLILGLY